jgi:hypothetical protein
LVDTGLCGLHRLVLLVAHRARVGHIVGHPLAVVRDLLLQHAQPALQRVAVCGQFLGSGQGGVGHAALLRAGGNSIIFARRGASALMPLKPLPAAQPQDYVP